MIKIILAVCITTLTYAAPAFTGDIEFKQKDGATFVGQLKGDEWFNWIEDEKEHIIKYSNRSKNFEYGRLKEINGDVDLVPSGVKVGSRLGTLSADQSKIDKSRLIEIWKLKKERALYQIQ